MVKSTLCTPLQYITTRVATLITRIYGICPSRLRSTSSYNFSIKTIINGVCHVITKEKKNTNKIHYRARILVNLSRRLNKPKRRKYYHTIYYILLRAARGRGMLCNRCNRTSSSLSLNKTLARLNHIYIYIQRRVRRIVPDAT